MHGLHRNGLKRLLCRVQKLATPSQLADRYEQISYIVFGLLSRDSRERSEAKSKWSVGDYMKNDFSQVMRRFLVFLFFS